MGGGGRVKKRKNWEVGEGAIAGGSREEIGGSRREGYRRI